MKYQIERPDPPRRQWIYLAGWVGETGLLVYTESDKRDWFRRMDTGHQISGEHVTYCVHLPRGFYAKRLSQDECLRIATGHFFGTGVRVVVDLGNWERGVVVTRLSNIRKITE